MFVIGYHSSLYTSHRAQALSQNEKSWTTVGQLRIKNFTHTVGLLRSLSRFSLDFSFTVKLPVAQMYFFLYINSEKLRSAIRDLSPRSFAREASTANKIYDFININGRPTEINEKNPASHLK